MVPDKETAAALSDGEELRLMAEGRGWAIAKKLLDDHIAVLDSVGSLPSDMSFEEIGKQAMFRAHAISLVRTWIQAVEGKVEQHGDQIAAARKDTTEDIVRVH